MVSISILVVDNFNASWSLMETSLIVGDSVGVAAEYSRPPVLAPPLGSLPVVQTLVYDIKS